MNKHICLICVGSNTNRDVNIPFAQKHLKSHFPAIILGSEQDTPPLFYSNPAHFTNQLGCFTTNLSIAKIKEILKRIERMAGRLPGDKAKEIVKLDIDLLIYDDQFLKEKDLEREYVFWGIEEIKHLTKKLKGKQQYDS